MFKVTHTLPEESYPDWLTLLAYSRFAIMHKVSADITMAVLDKAMRQVIPNITEFSVESIDPNLTKSGSAPPEFLALMLIENVTALRVKAVISEDDWFNALCVWAELGAAIYGKDPANVGHDMVSAFENLDIGFQDYQEARDTLDQPTLDQHTLAWHILPPSRSLH